MSETWPEMFCQYKKAVRVWKRDAKSSFLVKHLAKDLVQVAFNVGERRQWWSMHHSFPEVTRIILQTVKFHRLVLANLSVDLPQTCLGIFHCKWPPWFSPAGFWWTLLLDILVCWGWNHLDPVKFCCSNNFLPERVHRKGQLSMILCAQILPMETFPYLLTRACSVYVEIQGSRISSPDFVFHCRAHLLHYIELISVTIKWRLTKHLDTGNLQIGWSACFCLNIWWFSLAVLV